jgi:uncharacterized protein
MGYPDIRPDILTARGIYFDFLNPQTSMVWIEDVARGLSNICRFTGQARAFYSVAQHSVMVSRIVPLKHARAGLMHDAAEAYIGDVSAPLKNLLPDYRTIEARVERVVLEAFGLQLPLPEEVKRADLVMLATEKRDLMPAGAAGTWGLLKGISPLPEPIVPLAPKEAERLFLDRWTELFLSGRGHSITEVE